MTKLLKPVLFLIIAAIVGVVIYIKFIAKAETGSIPVVEKAPTAIAPLALEEGPKIFGDLAVKTTEPLPEPSRVNAVPEKGAEIKITSSSPAAPVPTVISPPAAVTVLSATPAPMLNNNPYITVPPPPPPAPPSVKGFVPIKTITRTVNITPNSTTAPVPGDLGVADGTPLGTWNISELKAAAFLRFDNKYVFKVRNTAYYNFYGYFIDASGNQTVPPFTGQARYTSFEIGNFY